MPGYTEPGGAFPAVPANQTFPSQDDTIQNLKVHRYGPAQNSRWVVWGHDIFGPESGRAREYCALLASTLNLTCIIPDFFRGNIPDFIPVPGGNPIPTWADTLQRDWVELLLPYLGQAGAQQVIPVGTCYGSYVVVHAAAESGGLVTGGVSIHPSHPPLMAMNGEDEAAVYRNISSPQYFMATPGDSDTVRPGGLASSIIQTTTFDEYEAPCTHGFFTRGDLSDPAVADCVTRAMENLTNFLNTYIPQIAK